MRRLEFQIDKEELQKALTDVSRIVPTKPHLQILSGIKLVVNADNVSITGNNGEMAINRRVNVGSLTINELGSAVIPAKNVLEIMKKLSGKVHIRNSCNQFSIRSGETIVHFPSYSSPDYPELPKVSQEKSLTVSSEEFYQVIKQTVYAVAKDFSRPSLTGVQFIIRDGELTCVATNAHRLALRKVRINYMDNATFTVPATSLNELLKLANHHHDDLHIAWSQTHIEFRTNAFTFYSNLIEGAFPNPSKLIPDTYQTTLILDTKLFLEGVDRACLFSNEWRNHNVLLEVSNDSRIKISSKGTETGRIEETQKIAKSFGAGHFQVTLDARFLLDALKVIDEATVKISYLDDMKPIMIEPVGNSEHLHLLSPVRTN